MINDKTFGMLSFLAYHNQCDFLPLKFKIFKIILKEKSVNNLRFYHTTAFSVMIRMVQN